MLLLYTGGMYLISIGIKSLIGDADIYIGFLWVIDLGVGLIFFIFILHFTSFLFQKSTFNLSARHFFLSLVLVWFLVIYFYYNSSPVDASYKDNLLKTWFFNISYIDYYIIFKVNEVTDLNTLRNTYFLLNSFEFYAINWSLLFGLLSAILLYFLIHKVFNYLNYSQIINYKSLKHVNTGFIIRNQNFMTQQNTFAVVNTWNKIKKKPNTGL